MPEFITVAEFKERINRAISAVNDVRVLYDLLDPRTPVGEDDGGSGPNGNPVSCDPNIVYEIPTPHPKGSKCWETIYPPILEHMNDPIIVADEELRSMRRVLDRLNPNMHLPVKGGENR
jgi:hypothetical protein